MTDAAAGDPPGSSDSGATAGWSVYLVRCRDNTLYTGIAIDVSRRLAQHGGEGGRGSKYLRGKGPLRLVYVRRIGARDLALRVEARIKRLRKARKEELVALRLPIDALLDQTAGERT